jgi:hypothetical protein
MAHPLSESLILNSFYPKVNISFIFVEIEIRIVAILRKYKFSNTKRKHIFSKRKRHASFLNNTACDFNEGVQVQSTPPYTASDKLTYAIIPASEILNT